jgi:hypothetical protein
LILDLLFGGCCLSGQGGEKERRGEVFKKQQRETEGVTLVMANLRVGMEVAWQESEREFYRRRGMNGN